MLQREQSHHLHVFKTNNKGEIWEPLGMHKHKSQAFVHIIALVFISTWKELMNRNHATYTVKLH